MGARRPAVPPSGAAAADLVHLEGIDDAFARGIADGWRGAPVDGDMGRAVSGCSTAAGAGASRFRTSATPAPLDALGTFLVVELAAVACVPWPAPALGTGALPAP
ncbi:MAG: hypothetical protein NVS3B26_29950 [Mycobacteriales bacterium]